MLRPKLKANHLGIICAIGLTAALALHQTLPLDPFRIGGLFVLSILAGFVIHLQMKRDHLPLEKRVPGEKLVWITTFLGVIGVQVVRRALLGTQEESLYLAAAPLAAQGLLIGGLVGPSLGSTTVTLASLLLGAAGVVSWPVLMVGWFLGTAGSWVITPLKRRNDLFRAISLLLVAGVLAAGAASYLHAGFSLQVAEAALWGGVSCIVAASIFWLGATVLEKVVGLTSDWTLLELCSPDHPLIQDLCMKAPGTYAHSVMVGNLAETAARTIGASPVVCRAMATFHDVGKLAHPNCFIENQRGINIHDDLSPAYSAQLIISHVREGVELAKKHDLPTAVVDAIAQHHGTSLLTPFFQKASNGSPVDASTEAMFRYPGPKPQSKEAAILHLADSVEAASRLLRPDDDVHLLVRRITARSLADGQLSECDLTFRELSQIQDSFASTLQGMRHERIHYPEALPSKTPDSGEQSRSTEAQTHSG